MVNELLTIFNQILTSLKKVVVLIYLYLFDCQLFWRKLQSVY